MPGKSKKLKAAVIYAPSEWKGPAEVIAQSLRSLGVAVQLKEAAAAVIPDLAAANLVLLGSGPTGKGRSPLPADFSELIRALKGVNLAGRVAGLFGAEEETLEALAKALQDTGITFSLGQAQKLLTAAGKPPEPGKLQAWLSKLKTQGEEKLRER